MISVIIPYKDAAEYLPRCIGSLIYLNGDYEFIFVNDRSNDRGPVFVDFMVAHDERIIPLSNDDIPGVSGARNVGLEAARGEWVTFLDADDYLLPGADRVLTNATKLDADIIQFNHQRYYPTINKFADKYDNAPGEYSITRRPNCWPMVWNKLFRRELLEGVRFWPCLQYGEDEMFVLKCLEKYNRIRCVEGRTVVHCYDNVESLTKTTDYKSAFAEVFALEELLIRSDDPEYKSAICDIIGEHWQSETYKRLFSIG